MRKLLIVIVIALLLRIALVFVAYHGDLNNNISWGTIAVERGLNGFYGETASSAYEGSTWPYSNPNQPPLTILTFAGARVVWQGIENLSWSLNNKISVFPSTFIWFWESKGMTLLVKLPGILADMAAGWLIYKYFTDRRNKHALLFATIWLFNPVIWFNSAIWGQTDSVVNLLGFMAIYFLLKKRLVPAVVFYVLSILFKGSLIIFAPILLLYAVLQKYPFKIWLYALCTMLCITFVISIWFHPSIDLPIWVVNLYQNRIFPGEIGNLTANAFNFWWLVNPGKVLDSTLFWGISARLWGIILLVLGFIVGCFKLIKRPNEKTLWYSLAFISLVSFLFMTRIHERYLYPYFLSGLILLVDVPGLIPVYVVLSLLNLLNLYHLFNALSIPILDMLYSISWLPGLVAGLTLVAFVRFFLESRKL